MKTNQGAIILAEHAADYSRLRAVLREWGYRESEIQRILKEPRVSSKLVSCSLFQSPLSNKLDRPTEQATA